MAHRTSGQRQDREAQTIDALVSHAVRVRRLLVGVSQEQLGELLGLSFQQIQKYENGKNRISAGRLFQIANFLGAKVETFFEGVTLTDKGLDDASLKKRERIVEFAMTTEGTRLMDSYLNAAHPRQRKLAMAMLHLPAIQDES